MHPFEVGKSYQREDVLRFLGSKQPVSGIVYGDRDRAYLAIFSGGRDGKRAGYPDGWDQEGVFSYCGQGSKGDQLMQGANARLARHDGPVLLFETWKPRKSWKGMQRFLGTFRVLGHEVITGEGIRKGDRLIIFSLVPESTLPLPSRAVAPTETGSVPLLELRMKAVAAGRVHAASRLTVVEYRERSDAVARYALARAAGVCECCRAPAPFCRPDGSPYLEVHHTRRLADDGPDDIRHVAAICPNCHREAHYGQDLDGFRQKLEQRILEEENSFAES